MLESNSMIDMNIPSILSKERREQLNQFAVQAFINTNRQASSDYDLISGLQEECYAFEEVLQEALNLESYINFFDHVNRAFELLIKQDQDAFRTYKVLNTMFRVFSRHQGAISNKLNEVVRIISDLDIIESEEIANKRGQSPC